MKDIKKTQKDNKTDSRVLANFKHSGEMWSKPDGLPDSNLLINFKESDHICVPA